MLKQGHDYARKLQDWDITTSKITKITDITKGSKDVCERTRQEKAHIALGHAFNSLGIPLEIDESKWHLIPALKLWKVRYELKVKPTAEELAAKEAKQQDHYNLIIRIMNDLKSCNK